METTLQRTTSPSKIVALVTHRQECWMSALRAVADQADERAREIPAAMCRVVESPLEVVATCPACHCPQFERTATCYWCGERADVACEWCGGPMTDGRCTAACQDEQDHFKG